jgi:hypothetical protein
MAKTWDAAMQRKGTADSSPAKNTYESPWDYTNHREELHVSNSGFVFHHKHGILCEGAIKGDYFVANPVRFKTRADAWAWIREGTIAEVQENLANLRVGFINIIIIKSYLNADRKRVNKQT